MKKLLALILALTMVFALAACGSEPAANSDAPSGDDVPSGEAVELTLTCNGTDQGNDTRSAKRFKELIEEKSEGRITVNIYNNDQLAGSNMTSAIELLTGGSTDIDIHSTSIVSSIAPEAMVCTMPWLFEDYQAAEDAFFGAGGEYMEEILSPKGVTSAPSTTASSSSPTASTPSSSLRTSPASRSASPAATSSWTSTPPTAPLPRP